jgi:hypothetical protein
MEKIGFKPMRRVCLDRFTVYCLRSLSHFSSTEDLKQELSNMEMKRVERRFPEQAVSLLSTPGL